MLPMASYSGYHLSENSQLCVESPSHKDDLFGEMAKQHGILATQAWHIAEFLKPSHRYLHQLCWTDEQIANIHEEGHHDGASDFSTLEYVLLKDAEVQDSWDLSDPADLQRLAETAFPRQLHSGLISSPGTFIELLATFLGERLNVEWLNRFRLRPQQLADVMDRLPIPLLRNYVESGLLSPAVLVAIFNDHLYRAGMDYQSRKHHEPIKSCCYLLFDEQYKPAHPALKQAVACYQLISGGNWRGVLDTQDTLILSDEQFRYFRESHSLEDVIATLADPAITLQGNMMPYISQALTTGHIPVATTLLKKQPGAGRYFHDFIREFMAVYGTLPRVSFDLSPFYQKVKQQQQNTDTLTIRQLCENGYVDALIARLQAGDADSKTLNAALQYAADKGYAHIVRLLHEAGAELDTWNNYAIKTANSKGFVPLQQYLRGKGVSWEAQEMSVNEWDL